MTKKQAFWAKWKGYIIASIVIAFLTGNLQGFKAVITHVQKSYVNERNIIEVRAEVSKKVNIELFERNQIEVKKELKQKVDTVYLYAFEKRFERVLNKVLEEFEQKKELKLTQK